MKNKKYHTVGTIPKSNIKIVERGIMYIPNTQMHDRLLSWLDTGTSIISGGLDYFDEPKPPLLEKYLFL
jgi:hypothetical protein